MISVRVGQKQITLNQNLDIVSHNLEGLEIYTRGSTENLKPDAMMIDVSVKIDSEDTDIPFDWIIFRKKRDALYLHHLSAPEEGKGFGKLGLAIFWAAAEILNEKRFAVRFGGGENSMGFMKSLGFKGKHLNKLRDGQTKGDFSVIVGDLRKSNTNGKLNDIYPISLEHFPTSFFNYRTGEDFGKKVEEDIRSELEDFRKLEKLLKFLQEDAEAVNSCLVNLHMEKDFSAIVEDLNKLQKLCHPESQDSFTYKLREIRRLCEQKGLDASNWASFDGLDKLLKNQKGGDRSLILEARVERTLEEVEMDESKEKKMADEDEWGKEKLVKERKYQKKLETHVFDKLRKIPDLGPVAKDIGAHKEKYAKKFADS